MVLFKNIRATVIRYDDKKPYPEYKLTQNATKRSQTVKEAYVEVVSGESFALIIEFLPGFDFQSSPGARVLVSFDGMKPRTCYMSKQRVTNSRSAAAIAERRITVDYTVENFDSKWMRCGLVFNELQLGTSLHAFGSIVTSVSDSL
jgi:hypothetical protein